MSHALVIVDIQNDYFPGGTMELAGADAAAAQAAQVLAAFRAKRMPVIHIQHLATRPGATFFLPGTTGAAIHASVQPAAGESVFTKHFPNAFRETPLLDFLRSQQITQLSFVGMMSHMCIDTSVRAATDLGFSCSVAHDACATKTLSFNGAEVPAAQVQAAYMAGLNGSFAKVVSGADLVAGLN
jgi:nicotinamidase-related amidase